MLVWVENPEDGTTAYLHMGAYVAVPVPDANDRNPADWWQIEAISGFAGERVAFGWNGYRNEPLEDLINLLAGELYDYAHEAFVSLDALRWAVVRQRYQRGVLPIVFIGRPEEVVKRTRTLLNDVHGPFLFTMIDKDRLVPAIIRSSYGRAIAEKINNVDMATGLLLRSIRFARPGKKPQQAPSMRTVPPAGAAPSPIVARDLVAFYPEWPPLDGIVRMPTVRADGTIARDVGYDAATRTWFEPEAMFSQLIIPDVPTVEQLEQAKHDVMEPFREFPFVDGPGAIMGALFEQFMIRMLGEANRPLHFIDAPPYGQGSGKTLCAQCVGIIVTGEKPAGLSRGSTDEELGKRIVAFLRKDTNFHLLDNMSHHVASDDLALLTTSSHYGGRILGVSESPALPNRATWMGTINGGTFAKDIIRRMTLTQFDAGLSEAYKRGNFEIRYLPEHVLANRARYVSAILTLIRGWICAGGPVAHELHAARGGFERWLDVVGSCVMWCGFYGLVQALSAAEGREEHTDDDSIFLSTWAQRFGAAQWVPPSQLSELAVEKGLYGDVLNKKGDPKWHSRRFAKEVLDRLVAAGRASVYGPKGHRYFAVVEK